MIKSTNCFVKVSTSSKHQGTYLISLAFVVGKSIALTRTRFTESYLS